MPKIVSIVYKPAHQPDTKDAYLRASLEEANLIAGKGIEGDRKGGGRKRHLNVMSAQILADLAAQGFATRPGQMGEQLVIAGLGVEQLPIQTRLKLGAEAVIEVYELRTGCSKFERVQDSPRDAVAGQLGMMARVIAGGKIRVGDEVSVIE